MARRSSRAHLQGPAKTLHFICVIVSAILAAFGVRQLCSPTVDEWDGFSLLPNAHPKSLLQNKASFHDRDGLSCRHFSTAVSRKRAASVHGHTYDKQSLFRSVIEVGWCASELKNDAYVNYNKLNPDLLCLEPRNPAIYDFIMQEVVASRLLYLPYITRQRVYPNAVVAHPQQNVGRDLSIRWNITDMSALTMGLPQPIDDVNLPSDVAPGIDDEDEQDESPFGGEAAALREEEMAANDRAAAPYDKNASYYHGTAPYGRNEMASVDAKQMEAGSNRGQGKNAQPLRKLGEAQEYVLGSRPSDLEQQVVVVMKSRNDGSQHAGVHGRHPKYSHLRTSRMILVRMVQNTMYPLEGEAAVRNNVRYILENESSLEAMILSVNPMPGAEEKGTNRTSPQNGLNDGLNFECSNMWTINRILNTTEAQLTMHLLRAHKQDIFELPLNLALSQVAPEGQTRVNYVLNALSGRQQGFQEMEALGGRWAVILDANSFMTKEGMDGILYALWRAEQSDAFVVIIPQLSLVVPSEQSGLNWDTKWRAIFGSGHVEQDSWGPPAIAIRKGAPDIFRGGSKAFGNNTEVALYQFLLTQPSGVILNKNVLQFYLDGSSPKKHLTKKKLIERYGVVYRLYHYTPKDERILKLAGQFLQNHAVNSTQEALRCRMENKSEQRTGYDFSDDHLERLTNLARAGYPETTFTVRAADVLEDFLNAFSHSDLTLSMTPSELDLHISSRRPASQALRKFLLDVSSIVFESTLQLVGDLELEALKRVQQSK